MNKTAIFVLYHKEAPLFSSGVYHPLQTDCANAAFNLGILRDNSGDNISKKNPHYGELSGWYWVWKNWLPQHPEIDRVGFCHYRRFLDPFCRPRSKIPFRPENAKSFSRRFSNWKDDEVDLLFRKADIALPRPLDLRKSPLYDRRHETVYTQYAKVHPVSDMDVFLEMLARESGKCAEETRRFFNGHLLRDCLMFVMRRDLFEDLAGWTFRLLFDLEKGSHWERYTGYMDIRTPAYIMERCFNVWLALHPEASVMERDSVRLVEKAPSPFHSLYLELRRFKHPPVDARSIQIPSILRP